MTSVRGTRMCGLLPAALLCFTAGLGVRTFADDGVMIASPPAIVQPAQDEPVASTVLSSAYAEALWESARAGKTGEFTRSLAIIEKHFAAADPTVSDSAKLLKESLAKREVSRGEALAEASKKLDDTTAKEQTVGNTVDALKLALEIQMLSGDRDAVLKQPRIAALGALAKAIAIRCERENQILDATELYAYLDALNDIAGTFRHDLRRLASRQEMLRLYAPERLWNLNNDRRIASGKKDMGPYNPLGGDWHDKLAPVNRETVERALERTREHIEGVVMSDILAQGLDTIKTLVTTAELRHAFTGLEVPEARANFIDHLDKEAAALRADARDLDRPQVSLVIDRMLKKNDATVRVPWSALLHEFGNGCMSRLDEYSAVIWPDEVRRFKKSTEGRFVGVGVQIENDEMQRVRVVTPIEGTPAQRAGIHSSDILTKVDGKGILGLSLDQVVDQITGKEGTNVVLTVERAVKLTDEELSASNEHNTPPTTDGSEKPAEVAKVEKTEELEFRLQRATIDVPTIKGWVRNGVRETDWDWFIDDKHQIGYVRLSQFADGSTKELDTAIKQMKLHGLRGLVFDLRFNPGGLLDQAVSIGQRFFPFDQQPIVMAQNYVGQIETVGYTSELRATLADVPTVVLVNEGSASASEIVSGAVSVYAKAGKCDALVLGARSFGKGSVQNVWPLGPESLMKVTTAYYMLPDSSIIHRRPGKAKWGVEPNLLVEMLPKQNSDALLLRRNADIMPIDENGLAPANNTAQADPQDLITKGLDLQLHAAMLLLQTRAAANEPVMANGDAKRRTDTTARQ